MVETKHPDVSVIRRALEGHLSPAATSTLLFDALSEYGRDVPQTMDDMRHLVRGPLAEALARRLDEDQARDLIALIEGELEGSGPEILIFRGDSEPPAPPARPLTERERDATAAVPVATAPVPVAVIAAGAGFAARLATALGPRRVALRAVHAVEELGTLPTLPTIVVVDATDFAAIEPARLAEALGKLPSTTAHVVWAAGLPYGRQLTASMQDAHVRSVPIGRTDGIAPLLDLIRSRRRADPTM